MAVPGRGNGMLEDDDNDIEDGILEEAGVEIAIDSDTPAHLTPLYEASQSGDVHALRLALDNLEVSVDEPIEDGDTALHLTCLYGHLACVQLPLERGASVLVKDEDGAVPLHDACAGGFTEIVQLLLSRATTPEMMREMLDALDEEADTPLHHAARGDHLDVVRLLLNHGASPLKKNIFDKIPEDLAELGTEAKLVLDTATTPAHLIPLSEASQSGDVHALRLALDNLELEVSVDEPIGDGDTALHLSCLYGHLACVQDKKGNTIIGAMQLPNGILCFTDSRKWTSDMHNDQAKKIYPVELQPNCYYFGAGDVDHNEVLVKTLGKTLKGRPSTAEHVIKELVTIVKRFVGAKFNKSRSFGGILVSNANVKKAYNACSFVVHYGETNAFEVACLQDGTLWTDKLPKFAKRKKVLVLGSGANIALEILEDLESEPDLDYYIKLVRSACLHTYLRTNTVGGPLQMYKFEDKLDHEGVEYKTVSTFELQDMASIDAKITLVMLFSTVGSNFIQIEKAYWTGG